jgi:membrane protein implicated in regulation of membrane protease activity
MTWATFYLACFLVGVTVSVLSFVGGSLHLPHLHLHIPHGHAGMPQAHMGGAARIGGRGPEMPLFNFATMTAFLTWFGGTGFLLTRYSTLVVAAILLAATAAGLLGAAVIFWFVVRLLLSHDRELDPADYERVGVLGRVSSRVRAGGTGEIIFSLAGTRQTCGARSEDGQALARGAEVIITRYEHGIAYVRRWDEMANEKEAAGD